jgi:glycosyltransferase involved in cell wall biosynthesis
MGEEMNNNPTPLVAIITPVYNGARFLAETMECVQAQTYPNLVHVILDNASTDATPDIIASFKDKRVPIVVHRNSQTIPMIENHNAAVSLIPEDAKYFRNLCADDLMTPDAIRRKVEIAESDPGIMIVGCQWRATGLCGSELPRDRNVFDAREIVRWYLRRETMVLSGTHTLIRRSAVDFSRPFYDDSTIDSWDAEANVRLIMQGKYGFVHDELALFRMHEFAHTANSSAKDGTHLFEWLVILDQYGPLVMSQVEYLECRKVYRRYLLRRTLLARWKNRDKHFYDIQMQRFTEINDRPGFFDFANAMLEWFYFAVTRQRHRVGAPSPSNLNLNG